MSGHVYDPNDVKGNEDALAATLAAQGIKYTSHVTPPMTMPTTEIVSIGKLAPGQRPDPAPVAAPPGAAIPANAATPNSPFVDYSAMNPMLAKRPLAGGSNQFVDTSGVTAPAQGFPALPVAPGAAIAPAIAPAQYVPAHFDESRINETPETVQAKLQTYDAQVDAQRNMAVAQADESRVAADQMAQETARANQSAANMQAKEDAHQQFVKERLAKLQTLSDASLNAQVDPHEWWESRSGLQTVAAGISLALGGALSGAMGQRNPGLDMINNAIQQNIDAQKTNIQLKQVGLSNQASMLEAYRNAFGDERLGDLAFEHAQRQNAISQMQADAMKSQAPQIMAAMQNAVAQLQRDQLNTKGEFQHRAYVSAHMVGGPGALHSVEPGRIVKMPNGQTVVVPTAQEGEKVRGRVGVVEDITDNFDRALKIRESASAVDLLNPYSEARKQLDSLKAETAQLMTVARGQGAMSKGDQDVADQAMGAFTGVLENNNAVIRSARERWGKQLGTEVRALGGEDIKQGYHYDAKGELEPGARYVGQADTPKPMGAPSSFKPAAKPAGQ